MKLSEDEIEQFVNLWMAVKPYITAKDKYDACQKFLMTLEDSIDIEEVSDELVGFDGTIDKVIRDKYTQYVDLDEFNEDDEEW
tara:strand:+ start:276 stop:524 length:249 start_codon:yes stop_codon:yes gene_type:complete